MSTSYLNLLQCQRLNSCPPARARQIFLSCTQSCPHRRATIHQNKPMPKSQWRLLCSTVKLSFNSLIHSISLPFGVRDDMIFGVCQRAIATYCSAKGQIVARLRGQDRFFLSCTQSCPRRRATIHQNKPMPKSQWGLLCSTVKLSFNSLIHSISPPFGVRDDMIFGVCQRAISTYCSAKGQIVARLRGQDRFFVIYRGLC
ncbi:Uncharacterised protein [Legionella moravica]|uniref:Uncharacterized protein n=1 Tax=Legionella moravica TaxID=39962 RepID=A0A378JXS9_9GAMM|nr:Uncharacterised protein [Legionella moravica]